MDEEYVDPPIPDIGYVEPTVIRGPGGIIHSYEVCTIPSWSNSTIAISVAQQFAYRNGKKKAEWVSFYPRVTPGSSSYHEKLSVPLTVWDSFREGVEFTHDWLQSWQRDMAHYERQRQGPSNLVHLSDILKNRDGG